MTVLVLPAAGKGTRLGSRIPKPLMPTGRDSYLIDTSLTLAAQAGIKVALIAVRREDLAFYVQTLGTYRHCVRLVYAEVDSPYSLNTLLWACTVAGMMFNPERYVVALPDAAIMNVNAIKLLLAKAKKTKLPCIGTFEDPDRRLDWVVSLDGKHVDRIIPKEVDIVGEQNGTPMGSWGLLTFDDDVLNRISRQTPYVPIREEVGLTHPVTADLLNQDLLHSPWSVLPIPGAYIDAGTWQDLSAYLFATHAIPGGAL